jgi:hypothetical protein
MNLLAGRLLLLLLLGVDWVASPEQLAPSVRALARRNASTVCLSQLSSSPSVSRRHAGTDGSPTHCLLAPESAGLFGHHPAVLVAVSAPVVRKLVYLLMSLRR